MVGRASFKKHAVLLELGARRRKVCTEHRRTRDDVFKHTMLVRAFFGLTASSSRLTGDGAVPCSCYKECFSFAGDSVSGCGIDRSSGALSALANSPFDDAAGSSFRQRNGVLLVAGSLGPNLLQTVVHPLSRLL